MCAHVFVENTTVESLDYSALVDLSPDEAERRVLLSYRHIGLQATQLGRAREIVQRALYHRSEGDAVFLAYTSNLISSGLRDIFTMLGRERLIDAFISTAGGIEEDVIKCLGPTVMGQFTLDGRALRRNGINRIGNLLVPNDNYCHFEDFFMPVLRAAHDAQRPARWDSSATTPSSLIAAMGAALGETQPDTCESSLLYWCHRHSIPVFSPALTDGSMGDMIYFYNFSCKGLVVDPVPDVLALRQLGCSERKGRVTCIVLGGGLPKHHLLRHVRADAVVCVTTGLEADGCPSSCSVVDDRANGALQEGCEVVRVHGDASVVFPLLLCAPGE